ncbi:hypothetical protein ANANG_G00308790, partial [Anguilla anguilla]
MSTSHEFSTGMLSRVIYTRSFKLNTLMRSKFYPSMPQWYFSHLISNALIGVVLSALQHILKALACLTCDARR